MPRARRCVREVSVRITTCRACRIGPATASCVRREGYEPPTLVRGARTRLEQGMCFSSEPMIVVPGQFGVRLEDHFYMSERGPRWFTEPSATIDEPFKGVEG